MDSDSEPDTTGYKCDTCGKSFENWNDHIKICILTEKSSKQKQQQQKMKRFHIINDENKENEGNGEAKDDSATYINIDLNNIKNEPLDVIGKKHSISFR